MDRSVSFAVKRLESLNGSAPYVKNAPVLPPFHTTRHGILASPTPCWAGDKDRRRGIMPLHAGTKDYCAPRQRGKMPRLHEFWTNAKKTGSGFWVQNSEGTQPAKFRSLNPEPSLNNPQSSSLDSRWNRASSSRGIGIGQDGGIGFRTFHVAERLDDFQHFAAGRKHPPATAFVIVEGAHELDFVGRVITFAGGRVDLSATTYLHASFERTAFDGHRNAVNSSLCSRRAAVVTRPTVDRGSCACRGSNVRLGRRLLLDRNVLGLRSMQDWFLTGYHGKTSAIKMAHLGVCQCRNNTPQLTKGIKKSIA